MTCDFAYPRRHFNCEISIDVVSLPSGRCGMLARHGWPRRPARTIRPSQQSRSYWLAKKSRNSASSMATVSPGGVADAPFTPLQNQRFHSLHQACLGHMR
jgi:hypothetical protein